MWSYDFEKVDPLKIKRTIIKQALNYGTFDHWRWIKDFYGIDEITAVLRGTPDAIDKKSRTLFDLVFN